MKALILHQPYATLVALGVKQWETRGGPPNGPMRPAGVRGMPGLAIEPGERIAIVAAVKAPTDMSMVGDWTYFAHSIEHWEAGHVEPAPLGVVVCTAVVAEVLPIGYDHPPDLLLPPVIDFTANGKDLLVRRGNEPPERISDQLPYGDWTPGRWAWRLTDVQQVDGPVEVVRGNRQGVFDAAVTW